MEEEIITHPNQTFLEDYLKEENELCSTCRWNNNGFCVNIASEEFQNSIMDINVKMCEYRYPNDEREIYQIDDDYSEKMEF